LFSVGVLANGVVGESHRVTEELIGHPFPFGFPRAYYIGAHHPAAGLFTGREHVRLFARATCNSHLARIAFISDRSGNPDVWAMPSNGGPARPITTHPANDNQPDWSPDGREIAFRSRRDGTTNIWIVPAEGGKPRRLTTDPAVDLTPQWSPDGKWVAFHSLRGGVRRHWRIPAEGGEARPVNESGEGKGVWSHDGTELFYACYSRKKLCAVNIETGRERIFLG